MVELDEEVLDEADHRGETMGPEGLVALVEQHHDDGRPGVPRELLAAYADALGDRSTFRLDADSFRSAVEDRLTDAETWAGRDALYEVGTDRVSRYPARWNDGLLGSTDPREYVEFLLAEDPAFVEAHAGTGDGIPEGALLDAVTVLGRMDREDARAALEDARGRGDVVEGADQHPDARVYLPEDTEDMRDESLDAG